ncbi:MAG: putative efflux pump rane transporter TtgB [Planctomycetota bacterium]
MWLIRLSIRNPYMVASLMLMLTVLGALCLIRIPIDILPAFDAPAVQVLTYFPGMPAESVEKTITNRIERWVNQAPGARQVESRSVPGVSVVKVYFREDIDPNEALTLTNSLALGALPNLPPNTLPPVALPFDATGTLPVGILTVENRNMGDAKQKDIARIDVRNMLGSVPGCIAPVVVGGQDRSVMVYLDQPKMESRGMVPMDVVRALQTGNFMTSPGTAYFGDQQLLIDSNSMVESVEQLNDLPLSLQPGTQIRLRDVGEARDSALIQTSRVRIDGENEVFVPIYRQKGSSSLSVVDRVREFIPQMQEKLPEGTKLDLVMDQTETVRRALHSLFEEAIIGIGLVALMILVFLGNFRMTLIAVLSIPLALLGAVIGLYVTGNTINAMTLAGLALAIGPLVDDAIVELENNHRNFEMGKSRIQSALDGCKEVLIPVLVASCTTVIVLVPLAFMPGIAGFLFRPLTVAVAFAMLTSFLLSRTFVPMACAKFLSNNHHENGLIYRLTKPFHRFLDFLVRIYETALSHALRYRWSCIALVSLLLLFSLGLIDRIGQEFFPQVDSGQLTMRLRAPSQNRLDATERRVMEVEEFVRKHISKHDLEMIVSEIGLNPDWSAAYTTNAGQQDALIRIQLSPERSKRSQEYAEILRREFSKLEPFKDLQCDFDTGGMISTALNSGASSPLNIQITGGTPGESYRVANEIQSLVRNIYGAADVRIEQRSDAPYLVLRVDREKSALLGLTTQDVIWQVVVALNSSVSVQKNFWIDSQSGNQYFVGVQFPEDAQRKLEDVLNIPVSGAKQPQAINLGSLVSTDRRNGAVEIHHSGLRRVTNVLVNTERIDIGHLAFEVKNRLSQVEFPKGIKLEFRGEYERMNESFRNLLLGLGLSAILVYLLQVSLFRSWTGPLVIMVTVPLGMIGVLWMLYLTKTTLNIQSFMGVIFLVGISVNNGVLLVDFANRQRSNQLSAVDAICLASKTRFKPILMTFLATLLALAPLALGNEKGNEANVPLARTVVGGLCSSTLLTLFFVPILYTILMQKFQPMDLDAEHEN